MLRCDAVHPGISICTNIIDEPAAFIRLHDCYSNEMAMSVGSFETTVALYFYQTTRRHAHKMTKNLTSHVCHTALVFRDEQFWCIWEESAGNDSRRMKKELKAGDNYILRNL